MQQTSDSGYILAGSTKSYGAGSSDVWLVKTDSNGNEQWNKTFGSTDDDWAHSVQQTSDSGYILAGETYPYGAGNFDFWLINVEGEPTELPVHNINSGENFSAIQEAIDDFDTKDGHTIIVDKRTYYENVVVNKSITLAGEDREGTIIDGGGVGDVVKVVADGCKISGFMVRNSGGIWDSTDAGIELASSNNNITDNNITNNHYNGILLNSSSNNTILNNIVSNTYNDEFPDGIGINLHCSTGNSIIDNNVNSNDRCGIFLFNLSNNNTIKNNTVSNNAWGIDLRYRSSHNYLSNNTLFNNGYRNLNVEGYNIEDFNNTIDINNTVNGKPVHYYFNKQNKTIENLDSGHLQLTYCSNITLKNSTVKDGDGIELDFTENSELVNNIVSNNSYGITLDHSSDNMIIENKAFNNGYGIYLVSDSNTNKIINNIVNLNGGNGILLSYSSNYNKIGNNTINGSSFGFQIHHSSNNQIIDNIISNNRHGIYLFWCSDKNTIANNTISNNTISGIGFFSDCINNTVYHNNFIHNIVQAEDYGYNNSWDSGPIEGGNYWSDHDCEGNPNNGSQPYYIDPNGKDSYPFQNENGWLISVVFDTGQPENPYPSIMGTHKGTITPLYNITVSKLYTYPCAGTGGHTESIKLYDENDTLIANGSWNGYTGDYHNITIHNLTGEAPYVTLLKNHEYRYVIKTGSYPQIIHEPSKDVTGGTITCDQFIDANGKTYTGWIPAIRLWAG